VNVQQLKFSASFPDLTLTCLPPPAGSSVPADPPCPLTCMPTALQELGSNLLCIIYVFTQLGAPVIVLAQEGEGAACGCSDAGLSAPLVRLLLPLLRAPISMPAPEACAALCSSAPLFLNYHWGAPLTCLPLSKKLSGSPLPPCTPKT
jgi:hypothetical protein